MSEQFNFSWLHGRCIAFSELNYGRPIGFNPVITQTLTVIQQYDPIVGDYRPFVVPVTQILDPFGEVNFHSSQSQSIISANQNPHIQAPQLQNNSFANQTATRFIQNKNFVYGKFVTGGKGSPKWPISALRYMRTTP
jgi:hypothetical protein